MDAYSVGHQVIRERCGTTVVMCYWDETGKWDENDEASLTSPNVVAFFSHTRSRWPIQLC